MTSSNIEFHWRKLFLLIFAASINVAAYGLALSEAVVGTNVVDLYGDNGGEIVEIDQANKKALVQFYKSRRASWFNISDLRITTGSGETRDVSRMVTSQNSKPLDERYIGWTQGTSLESCRECKSTAFHENVRKRYANQHNSHANYAGAVGYVVFKDKEHGGFVRMGRMVLMGTGRLGRTDSHVLFNEREEFRHTDDGKMYFEPMLHQGERNYIELDLASVQVGAKYTAPINLNRLDWANVFLKEDAVEKFNGKNVFALLWKINVSHGLFQSDRYRNATKYVYDENNRLLFSDYCRKVDHEPTDFYKRNSINGLAFGNCPKNLTRPGASGSPTVLSTHSGLYFANQLITNETDAKQNGPTGNGRDGTIPQAFLGLTPESKVSLNSMYVQDLRSRGVVIDAP